jgi:pSer/pThr/pTyr-binding forkhead associated (FHA) protein
MHVKLKVLRGASAGKEIVVRTTKFLIGRSEDCHLRANSDALSRRHCAILVDERDVKVRDLGSRNGTFVNGVAIEGDQRLQMGDQLRVGPLEFLVTYAKAAQAAGADGAKPVTSSSAVPASDDMAGLISDWLTEADEADRKTRAPADAETRALRVDETDRIKIDTAKIQPPQTEANNTGAPAPEEPEPASDRPTTTFSKRTPGRSSAPKDTQEAAAQTLRKFFNRGG